MRIISVLIYITVMFYFLFRGLIWAFLPMVIFALIFIGSFPFHRENKIKVAKKKIYDAQKAKQGGEIIKPFIDINSSPWYVLAQLPGISKQMAKHAVELRKQNGSYPSINAFLEATGVKHIYFDHIKAVAFVKNETPPVK